MADCRRFLTSRQLDLEQILKEAQHRWLRPAEICEILRNYRKFDLTPEAPNRPPAGSLFLFDRKALRYFRKDGHRWRKKRDGKTVKEAHEKLKAGSVDVLHCYYAHGEDNDSFQRRSYWMLDGQLEHIVLVHYREVNEGNKPGTSHLLADKGIHIAGSLSNSDTGFVVESSPASTVHTSFISSASRAERSVQAVSSDLEDVDSLDLGVFSLARAADRSPPQNSSFLHENSGLSTPSRHQPAPWFCRDFYRVGAEAPLLAENDTSVCDTALDQPQNIDHFHAERPAPVEFIPQKLTDCRFDPDSRLSDVACGEKLNTTPDYNNLAVPTEQQSQIIESSVVHVANGFKDRGLTNEESGELKKLDSFGRWMDREMGRDCDDSLMASGSGKFWSTLNSGNDVEEVSNLSQQMQHDTDSLGPSLSQEQLFSISDFSPDWAYSDMESKVLIIGTFLGSKKLSGGKKWGCMFGEIEVPAEILSDTSIRCLAPPHAPGRVPFYVTCCNRLACSEIQEFEYREMPDVTSNNIPEEEARLQVRLAKLLHLGQAEQCFNCSLEVCNKCDLKKSIYAKKNVDVSNSETVGDSSVAVGCPSPADAAFECLVRDRVCQWLVYKLHEGGKGPHVLDEQGQGLIHLTAALGYGWAINPIIAAGIRPNFRDVDGRTGLHWASYFGREETVIALIGLGADSGVVDDPRPAFPGGQTPADLAASRGHKGIAAYLAEADLISRLSSLTVNEKIPTADLASSDTANPTELTTEATLSQVVTDNKHWMKESLDAVRKSAHAAALIQTAFRARSFCQREQRNGKNDNDICQISTDLVALGSLRKVQNIGRFKDYLHSAAIKIQQNYRGWKGRREFLKIRKRIVKVQAHVRGHQVRKQYKKVVRSVSILEKAILRWRRKRVGLRGFQMVRKTEDADSGVDKTDEYDYLRIGRKQKVDGVERALARVKSLVRNPKARDQYMRLVTKFENLKANEG